MWSQGYARRRLWVRPLTLQRLANAKARSEAAWGPGCGDRTQGSGEEAVGAAGAGFPVPLSAAPLPHLALGAQGEAARAVCGVLPCSPFGAVALGGVASPLFSPASARRSPETTPSTPALSVGPSSPCPSTPPALHTPPGRLAPASGCSPAAGARRALFTHSPYTPVLSLCSLPSTPRATPTPTPREEKDKPWGGTARGGDVGEGWEEGVAGPAGSSLSWADHNPEEVPSLFSSVPTLLSCHSCAYLCCVCVWFSLSLGCVCAGWRWWWGCCGRGSGLFLRAQEMDFGVSVTEFLALPTARRRKSV